MSYSLNEYEALCKKAARGSGMHWGQAEEVGKAARSLGAYCLDDGRLVLNAIERFGPQNALWLGPALCDEGQIFEGVSTVENVEMPTLMLPFLHMMVLDHEICLSVTWDRFKALISADGIDCILSDGLSETGPLDLKVSTISAAQATEPRLQSRIDVPQDIFDRLSALAHKTYAPATEESRLAGAGAGLSDND